MGNNKILIVDDEKQICDLLATYLSKDGYEPMTATSCEEAKEILNKLTPDLIILDIMLPDKSGMDLCMEIRRDKTVPIIFLSCKTETIDKIMALSVGGDDYITKPFIPEELLARVKAQIRRSEQNSSVETDEEIYTAPGLTVNVTSREVFLDGELINMPVKEFDILHLLIKNSRRIYSAYQIYEHAWQINSITGDEKTVMVYISNIRKKIENNKNAYKYIISVRGLGYKFNHQLIEQSEL